MNTLRKFSLSHIVAAVAIAGLSLSAAYAVPQYTPDTTSPINSPDGGANLGAGLALINAQLASGLTLVTPAANVLSPVSVNPDKTQFLAALRSAVAAAATPALKASILHAGLFVAPTYKVSTLNAVQGVLEDYLPSNPTQADVQLLLDAALLVNNGKSGDVMKALIVAIGKIGTSAQEGDSGAYAADSFGTVIGLTEDASTKAALLVQGLAENAIKNTKPNSSGTLGYVAANLPATVTDTATDLMAAAVASGSKFVIDDVARGISMGIKPLLSSGVTYNHGFTAIAGAVGTNPENKAHALAGMIRVLFDTDTAELAQAKAAFGNNPLLNAVVDGYQLTAAQLGGAAARQADFEAYATVNPTKAAHYALGAVYLSAGLVPLFVETGMDNITLAADKKQMLAFVSRAQNAQAAKAAGKAVQFGGLSFSNALEAALPNTVALYAGSVAKEVTKAATLASATDIVTAAVNALEAAVSVGNENDFNGGTVDVIAEIMKLRKTPADFDAILAAGLAAANTGLGTREAVAVAVGRGDFKSTSTTSHAAAIMAAIPAGAERDSVLEAESMARIAKTTPKLALSNALARINAVAPESLGAVVLGAGSVDAKLVEVLLASALREGGSLTTAQKAQLLNHAKAVGKKNEVNIQLAFDTANLVLANTDELLDIVDHQMVKYSKSQPTIATAAAAAAPGYANFVARAAGFRATSASVSKLPLAIIQGADMNANPTSNPSAVAAIAAGYICGIKDAKQSAINEPKLLTSAMFALVKAAMGVGDKGIIAVGTTVPASGAFRSVNIDTGAAPTGANQPEYGSAAVVTGVTSILSNTGVFTPSAALLTVLTAAGKAVGNGTHTQATVIAQAAMQAFVWVTGVTGLASDTARDAIVLAIKNGSGVTDGRVLAAANAGRAEALALFKGAGAPGVLDYAHFNCNNSPVTDILGF